jgi:hypothetical protein
MTVVYLDNSVIRIGVSKDAGGAIVWASDSKTLVNVINHGNPNSPNPGRYDPGRMLQQSWYADPNPYMGHPWAWNANQAGDDRYNLAPCIRCTIKHGTLYTKVQPLIWSLNNVPAEAICEQWITLQSNVATVRGRFTASRTDITSTSAHDQEPSSLHCTGQFYRIFTYTGSAPWTGGPLTQFFNDPYVVPFAWPAFTPTEYWACAVADNDWGVCLYAPEVAVYPYCFKGGNRYPPMNDPTNWSDTSLPVTVISAIPHFSAPCVGVFDYTYYLIFGYRSEFQPKVYQLAGK